MYVFLYLVFLKRMIGNLIILPDDFGQFKHFLYQVFELIFLTLLKLREFWARNRHGIPNKGEIITKQSNSQLYLSLLKNRSCIYSYETNRDIHYIWSGFLHYIRTSHTECRFTLGAIHSATCTDIVGGMCFKSPKPDRHDEITKRSTNL